VHSFPRATRELAAFVLFALQASCSGSDFEVGGSPPDGPAPSPTAPAPQTSPTAPPSADHPAPLPPPPYVCADGEAPTVLVGNLNAPEHVVVDGGWLYYTTLPTALESQGAVWRVPTSGGATELLSAPIHPRGLALAGEALYVADAYFATVWRVQDGSTFEFAKAPNPAEVVFDGVDLFWAELGDGAVVRSTLGGERQVLAKADTPWRVAVGADRVYWTHYFTNDVHWVTKDGAALGTIESLAPHCVTEGPDGLVYWTAGGLFRADPKGANVEALSLDDGLGYEGVAVDGEYAFVAALEGSVLRHRLADGQLEVVATGQDQPSMVARDETCVYWTNRGTGEHAGSLMRAGRRPSGE